MDRYLFRGKRVDNREWYEGFFTQSLSGKTYITNRDKRSASPNVIDENTLGQCTGLKDKNGKLIFEGDKVKVTYNNINPFDEYSLAVVKWMDDVSYPAFDLEFYEGNDHFDCNAFSWIYESGDYDIEIIGTIHDKEVCAND